MYLEFLFSLFMFLTYVYKYGADFDREVILFLLTFMMVHTAVDAFLIIVNRLFGW